MIYFVDEDESQVRPFRTELELRDYQVTHLFDADSAYIYLSEADDIELVLIDVMLSVSVTEEDSRFTRKETEDYTLTGLFLLEELIEVNKKFFPEKAVLFSIASSDTMVRKIGIIKKKHSIEFLRKTQFSTPFEFGDKIETILKKLEK